MISSPFEKQIIGEIIKHKGSDAIRDLFSDKIYPLAAKSGADSGSIIQVNILSGHAEIISQLAPAQSIQASLYQIAAKYQLNPIFSSAINQEVDEILKNPGLDDSFLINLEDMAFCTIDDASTRDLDQALFIEKIASGFHIYYALADAAYYVRPGTNLFDEALQRGSSYYLPGLMIPMLPRPLSEGLISLNEKVLRRALVFKIHLDAAGICIDTQIMHARIKSQAKLSFEQVQTFLDSPASSSINNLLLEKSLSLLKEVGELRIQLADERNIARYRRHEVHVTLGKNGCRFTLLDSMRNDVERYNEQLSLLCNIEGARFLKKNDTDDDHMHPIYRVHPHPPQTQIKAFEQRLKALIKIHNLDPELWSWQANTSKMLAHYLKALPSTGPLSRIAQAIHRQAVMINVRSTFSEEAAKHHGVGADVYARFSAPMREIVGVFLHKEVAEKLAMINPSISKNDDKELRSKIIKVSNQCKTIQKKIGHQGNLLILNQIFEDDLQHSEQQRPSHIGTVIGIDNNKLYVLLDMPQIEVKVYIKHLESELKTSLSTDNEKVSLYQSESNKLKTKLGDSICLFVKGKDQTRHDRWILLIA